MSLPTRFPHKKARGRFLVSVLDELVLHAVVLFGRVLFGLALFGLVLHGVSPASAAEPDADVSQLVEQLGQADGESRIPLLAMLVEVTVKQDAEGAREYALEALELLERNPDPEIEARVRLGLSWVVSRTGDPEAGLVEAERAKKLAVQRQDTHGEARADYHIALAQWYLSDTSAALASVTRARDRQMIDQDLPELARTLTLMGAIQRARGDAPGALGSHLEALEIAKDLGDQASIARSHNNIGLIYWNFDQPEIAREWLLPALQTYRNSGHPEKLASILSNLGLIYIELDEPQEALELLREGLALQRAPTHIRNRARLLSNMGYAYEKLGQDDIAMSYQLQTLEMREELGESRPLSRTLGSIAGIYRRAGRHEEALETYLLALEHAEKASAKREQKALHEQLAFVYQQLGQPEQAFASYGQYQALAKELDSVSAARQIANLEAAQELAEKQRELDSVERARIEQELELSQERNRRTWWVMGTLLLSALAVGLLVLNRSRSRSLAAIQASHQRLQRTTGELREMERRYRSVFDDAIVPRLFVDLESRRVIDANAPASQLKPSETPIQPSTRFSELQPEWLSRSLLQLEERLGEARCLNSEWKDASLATRHAEVWVTPLLLSNRQCALVTIHDVTEQRKLEEDRIRRGKLESLGQLAGGIAHDFNNALTAILGYLSMAKDEVRGDSNAHSLLLGADSAISESKQLTSQLLAFAKGGEPQRECVDVAKILKDSVRFGLSGSSVRTEFELAPDLWPAELDRSQFKQAVSHIALNAAQAMDGGGRLTVQAGNFLAERSLSSVAGPGHYIKIQFTDTGPGIAPEVQDRILEPYFSTKGEGAGLGLATVFAVLTRHQGFLEFESAAGVGSTFSLYFPAEPEASTRTDEPIPAVMGGSGSILVMDDDPLIQDVYRIGLQSLGYDVDVVEDGEAAIQRYIDAAEADDPYDLVIMDLTIPGGMGGKQAMEELRLLNPDIIGVVASGYSQDPVMSDFRKAGFAAALPKPFSIQQLGGLLRQLIARRERPRASRPRRAPNDSSYLN